MNIEWMFEPVTQASVLGVGVIGSLALWFSAKNEVRASEKTLNEFRVTTEAAMQQLIARVEEMKTVPVDEPAPATAPLMNSQVMNAQGLNLTTRVKALRMYRRGETISSISAALGAHQEEVELLLKLNRLLETPLV